VGPDPADDGAEHISQFGADHQQPFGVGFGRGDLQQGHQLAGGRQPVLHQAVVAELDQFLDADAGGPEHFDDRPGPERVAFFGGEVAPFAGAAVLSPDVDAAVLGGRAGQGLPGSGEGIARPGVAGGVQQGLGMAVVPGGGLGQDRQHREPFAGAGVHP
jgi:hypothetical protein